MLMLMKIKSKCKHKVREHNKISINKTKHEKQHCKQNKTTNANKSNGGSVLTAIGFPNLIILLQQLNPGTSSPNLILF